MNSHHCGFYDATVAMVFLECITEGSRMDSVRICDAKRSISIPKLPSFNKNLYLAVLTTIEYVASCKVIKVWHFIYNESILKNFT